MYIVRMDALAADSGEAGRRVFRHRIGPFRQISAAEDETAYPIEQHASFFVIIHPPSIYLRLEVSLRWVHRDSFSSREAHGHLRRCAYRAR